MPLDSVAEYVESFKPGENREGTAASENGWEVQSGVIVLRSLRYMFNKHYVQGYRAQEKRLVCQQIFGNLQQKGPTGLLMESKAAEKARGRQQLRGQQVKSPGRGQVGEKSGRCHLRNQVMNGFSRREWSA